MLAALLARTFAGKKPHTHTYFPKNFHSGQQIAIAIEVAAARWGKTLNEMLQNGILKATEAAERAAVKHSK